MGPGPPQTRKGQQGFPFQTLPHSAGNGREKGGAGAPEKNDKSKVEGIKQMSKYDSLWEYVRNRESQSIKLTFEEIRNITGIPIDHSFLKYKKELTEYGYQVGKISMKEQTIIFNKID